MRTLALFLILGALAGCKAEILPGQIDSYVLNEKRGLTVSDTFGRLKIICSYYPEKYCAAQQCIQTGKPFKKVYQDLKSQYYLELRLSDTSGTKEFLKIDDNPGNYQQRLSYLLNDFHKDVYLVINGDTLTDAQCYFERTYGLTPYNKVLLSFNKPDKEKKADKILFIKDNLAGGRAMIFKISYLSERQSPPVKLKKNKIL